MTAEYRWVCSDAQGGEWACVVHGARWGFVCTAGSRVYAIRRVCGICNERVYTVDRALGGNMQDAARALLAALDVGE